MSLIRRGFHIATKQLVYLVIILLVLLIASLGVIYWLSDAIEQRQDEIATWASEQVGYPVEIGSAGLEWLGILPKLQLQSVSVQDKKQQAEILSLDELYVGLDIIASVSQGSPVLNDVTLTGLAVSLQRDTSGKIQIKGFDLPETSAGEHDWLSWLRILNRFHLQSITIDYTDQISPELSGSYQLTNAIVSHKSDQWTTTGNIRLPSSVGQQLQFQAQADIESFSSSTWQGQVKATSLQLDNLTQQIIWQDVAVEQGSADINLSVRGHGNTFDSLVTDIVLSKTNIVTQQKNSKGEAVIIDQLLGTFDWQNKNQSWQLSGRDIHLHINGIAWPKTGFTIKKNNDDSWFIASNYIRLSDISSIASLSQYSPEILRQLKPAGDINKVNLRYSADKGLTGLAFNLRDGASEPWNEYPGVTGLTVSVNWNDGLANIQLESHKLTIYAEKWLDDAVFFDSVTGSIDLQKTEKTWLVKSNQLRVWNDDLTLQLDGQIEKQTDGEIVNALKVKIEEFTVNRWQDYVPQKILSKPFQEWSNKAFQAGTIIDGEIEWVGDLSSFPYKEETDSGFFKMDLNVEDIQLHYAPDWPELFGVTGTITGHGHDLIIKSKQGKIADFYFADVTTVITKLDEAKPILTVEGDLTGTSQQAAAFLQNSPLSERFGSDIKSIELTGGSNIHLNLMVPLTDPDETQASGYVSFIDSQLSHQSLAATGLSNVNGQLNFDNNGVYAEKITANLFNEVVNINVKPEGKNTKVSLLGHVAIKEITSLWPDSIPAFISGETDYKIEMTVLEKAVGDFYLNTELKSSLKGIEIDMPKPFTKERQAKQLFIVALNTIEDELVFSFKYGDEVNIIAAPNDKGLRAAIKFGQQQAELPENGIKVRGKLAELSIDDWLNWTKGLAETKDNSLLANIDDISMTIDLLTGFDQKLTALNYSINKDGQGWRINLNSDQTKGAIYWPESFNGSVPLDINLDKLLVTLPKTESDDNSGPNEKADLWPAMTINIDSLVIDDIELGKLTLNASRSAHTWSIDTASLSSKIFTAEVVDKSTLWQKTSAGQKSKFAMKAYSNDLAGLLANFGYQAVMQSDRTDIMLDLSWPGNPLAVSRESMSGQLNIEMGKGKLNDVEPGAAGRIFGLMSVTALPQRLGLDFSDLFASGFTFYSIKGDFNYANGQAVTDNLTLIGAPAKIEMSGPIDVVNQQYNQQVKVTPNVSSALPLAGAVAAGPVGLGVGAALLVVDKLSGKLLGKNVVNLISYKYYLTGPWNDPQVTVIKPEIQ